MAVGKAEFLILSSDRWNIHIKCKKSVENVWKPKTNKYKSGSFMARKKGESNFIKIRPDNDKMQLALEIFYQIKSMTEFTSKSIFDLVSMDSGFISNYLASCAGKKMFKVSGSGMYGDIFRFNGDFRKIVGIGFRGGTCFITLMDMTGSIVDKEKMEIELLLSGRGKRKDIAGIVKEIAEKTKLKDADVICAAVAMPEEMVDVNPKSIEILSEGIADIFKCEVFVTKSATAAGYGNRDFSVETRGKDILYMHSDIGIGVIFKKEMIFEADEYSEEKYGAYLRPWNQFSIVNTTKDLVLRGVGTDIVEMVKGDVEKITLDTVLEAAEKKDELAEDLVKRSGIALGVRVAYLINMFGVKSVLFGGGTEKAEGRFIPNVLESINRFISKDIVNELRIVPGVLGETASSIGAALLCRREMFMEV